MKILFLIHDFIIEPLGIMYLSRALKRAGHQVDIIKTDYNEYYLNALSAEGKHRKEIVQTEEDIIRLVRRHSPQIIAFSVTTGMHSYYASLSRKIKKKMEVVSVFGGPHPTFFPEFINEEGVDIICRGEGEEAFLELVENLEDNRPIGKIRNLWVKNQGTIHKNEVRPLIDNLDKIAFPDRKIAYQFETSLNNPIRNFMLSRGCPYNCPYCFNHAYFELYKGKGKRVRFRSVSNLVEEIKEVREKYPLGIVYIQDDIFILSRKIFYEFSDQYQKEINLPFHCHLRADLVDEEIVKRLRETNCLSVTLAIESGNAYLRNEILKRNMSEEQIYTAARLLRKYGIRFRIENMIGLPGGSLSTAFETLRMNIKCQPDIGWASLYQPYPRTILGIYCQEKGLYDGRLEDIRPSFFETSILKMENKKKIENLQKLFSITVEFPFLLPLVKLLIKFPPNRIFDWIYKRWKKYCYDKRLYRVRKRRQG